MFPKLFAHSVQNLTLLQPVIPGSDWLPSTTEGNIPTDCSEK